MAPSPSGPPPAAIDPETPVASDAPPGGGDPGSIPGAGRIVVPKPGQFDVRPISAQTLSAQVDGRRVVIAIDYTSGVEPCYVLDSILVQPGPRSFAITLREGNGGGGAMCIELAEFKRALVDLGELEPGTYTISRRHRRRSAHLRHGELTGPVRRARSAVLCDDRPVNPLDAITLLLVVVALILGWRSGAIPQVAGLIGAIAGGAAAILALPYLADTLTALDPAFRPVAVLLWLVGAVAIGESIGASLGRAGARALGNGLLGAADRTAGAGLGAVQALLIVWLTGSLLAEGPLPRLAETAGGSTAVRTMATILPPPTEIAVGLGGWLDATGLPDVFVGFEPLPAAPVDRPTDPTARAIAAVAEASTMKVSAATCGFSSVGTGFVVAPGYVVTNAHVVAGADARGVRVSVEWPRPPRPSPCCSIPISTSPSCTSPISCRSRSHSPSEDPGRGTVGATLGYPGGGALTILPAAVTARYAAVGHDIYGQGRIRRQVLELHADIDRGDSGGPLMLRDGTVGGVVFAEARTNPDVGYALRRPRWRTRSGPASARRPRSTPARACRAGDAVTAGPSVRSVGFVGLGVMGRPMAHRILGGGFDLTVASRSAAAVAELVAAGAREAALAPELARARGPRDRDGPRHRRLRGRPRWTRPDSWPAPTMA